MLSCNNRTQKNDDASTEVTELLVDHNYYVLDREPLADSTWYNHLVEAWEKRDTAALRPFFESWYQHTLKTDCTPDVPYRAVMDTIIRVIYGSVGGPPPPPEDMLSSETEDDSIKDYFKARREYAIFDSGIYYSVIDTTQISFEDERNRSCDTMYFRPDEKLLERKIIMWTDPYRRYLDAFLTFDHDLIWARRDKLDFIEYYIEGGFKYYIEEPRVHIIILNKELDAAYVEYHYIETGMAVWLVRRDGRWIIVKSEQLYIS